MERRESVCSYRLSISRSSFSEIFEKEDEKMMRRMDRRYMDSRRKLFKKLGMNDMKDDGMFDGMMIPIMKNIGMEPPVPDESPEKRRERKEKFIKKRMEIEKEKMEEEERREEIDMERLIRRLFERFEERRRRE